jgi:hypothetical protein
MKLFIHKENQEILWNLISKTDSFKTLLYQGYNMEAWFKSSIEKVHSNLSTMNINPTNAKSLLEVNKQTLIHMSEDLKNIINPKQIASLVSSPNPNNHINPGLNPTMNNYSKPYDPNAEREMKELIFQRKYDQYQNDYNKLLEKPTPPVIDFTIHSNEDKIANMDELLKMQQILREKDLAANPSPMASLIPTQTQPPIIKPAKLQISNESLEIEPNITIEIESNTISPVEKSVSWSSSTEFIEPDQRELGQS